MNYLQMGGNTLLASPKGKVTISYEHNNAIDVSLTAFLLTNTDKVQGDEGIVFYNQPNSSTGMANLLTSQISGNKVVQQITYDLSKAPHDICKIAITLTEDNNIGFKNVNHLVAEVDTGKQIIQLTPASFTKENGIVVLELYIRNNEYKVRSIWRGFESGLQGLCHNYGVEVESTSNAEAPSKVPKEQPISLINLQKVTGKIDLNKGQKSVIIDKTPLITATVSWKSGTDYDIYALVYTKAGKQVDVAMFGAKGVPPLQSFDNGAVKHLGDVQRDAGTIKKEVIQLKLNANVLAVVPVVYSAQSNGTGSFYRYKVSMSIDNHQGTSVTIHAKNANNNDLIYTCVPGILHNTDEGVIITPLELYSAPNSERRPKLKKSRTKGVEIIMDRGPVNHYK